MIAEETLPNPKPGFFALLAGVVLHPRRTFTTLSEQGCRSWLAVALLAMVFAVLPTLVAAPITAKKAQEVFRAQMESRAGQAQAMTEEQLEQAEKFAANPLFSVVFPSLLGLIGLWFTWLIWSGSLHLLSTMLGGSNSFKQVWQVVVWSWVPFILRGLVQSVFILVTGSLIEHPGLSGLVSDNRPISEIMAAPPGTGQLVLGAILGRIDLFHLWNLALLIVGITATARISRRKGILVTLGVWIVLTLLGLIPVLISSSFARGFSGA